MTRSGWVVAGGIAAILAAVLITVLFALGTALGAAAGGATAGDALLGSAALGLYAAAIVGIGVAIGGLWRTSLAAEIAALFVVATFLLDILAPPFRLPDWVHQLALTAHCGQPMLGQWDLVGSGPCVAIAVGGRRPRRVGDRPGATSPADAPTGRPRVLQRAAAADSGSGPAPASIGPWPRSSSSSSPAPRCSTSRGTSCSSRRATRSGRPPSG